MRKAYYSLYSLFLTSVATTHVFAQAAGDEEEVAKSYVASYFIVGLGVALGLVAVCRGSKRQREVRKPE